MLPRNHYWWKVLFLLLFLTRWVYYCYRLGVILNAWLSMFLFYGIYLCSSLDDFKNGPAYLTRRVSPVFIPLIIFLCCIFWFRDVFLFFWGKHIWSCWANLSCMDLNFLHQDSGILSYPDSFQFATFLGVFCRFSCISASRLSQHFLKFILHAI